MRKFSLERLFYSKKFNPRVNIVVMEAVFRLARKLARSFLWLYEQSLSYIVSFLN